jgi:hypothetical protein
VRNNDHIRINAHRIAPPTMQQSFPKLIGMSTARFLLSRTNVYLNNLGKNRRWEKNEENSIVLKHNLDGLIDIDE